MNKCRRTVMPSVPCFVVSLLWSHFTLQQWQCSAGMFSRIKTEERKIGWLLPPWSQGADKNQQDTKTFNGIKFKREPFKWLHYYYNKIATFIRVFRYKSSICEASS